MMKHLLNNRGESLAEVLVAVLIIAAGLLALAGMVRVATKSVINSKNNIGDFYQAENTIEDRGESESDKLVVENKTAKIGNSEVPVTIYSKSYDNSDKNKVYRYEVQKENNNANQNNE